jgi:hypothetical protein
MAKIVDYLSLAITGLSLLIFFIGYFGAKLQGLEGTAVVQLAALLLLTLKDVSPAYVGLKRLGYSLGITPLFFSPSSYEDSSVPSYFHSLLPTNNTMHVINIAFVVVLIPLLASVVFKILSITSHKDSKVI